jgi:hypothetical protein
VVIGTIVKSNSHISYMCRVYGKLEAVALPSADDHAFGTFVTLNPVEGTDVTLVGVVRDTFLVNPDYGSPGPRLSSSEDLAVFSPDFLNEKGVLVEILVVGWMDRNGCHHGVPALAAQVGTKVETMSEADVCRFHTSPNDTFLIGYLPQFITGNDPMTANLLLSVLDRLEPHFPEQQRVIGVLKNNLAWKSRVVPAG